MAWLGAVQAQDYPAAKWALGMRVRNATDALIEKAMNDGSILRTHVMRPTWHFVSPRDIRWMLELTAPRVRSILSHYDRTLGLTAKTLTRCAAVIARALEGGRHLTRDELAGRLERARIEARGQRLARIVMHSELNGLICSGPRRGKQFTYALLDERVPRARSIDRDEALAMLARRYFVSHGPAQVKDFTWWSGLTVKDATAALDAVKPELIAKTVDGKTYWFAPARVPKPATSVAMLLSIYDEYTIAYKDRSALGGGEFRNELLRMGNALTSVLTIDGLIAGTWKRTLLEGAVDVAIRPLRRLTAGEKDAVAAAGRRYGRFLGTPVTMSGRGV
ncbi:MAG: winged helix DNA-binding domain-containing protein [Candidatus Latescibacteria bacterium]|nr:winged helix DNA-binding domain-containing protein [Candidatus Latescibacterota bacterium]